MLPLLWPKAWTIETFMPGFWGKVHSLRQTKPLGRCVSLEAD
jgi:hypothetical protein